MHVCGSAGSTWYCDVPPPRSKCGSSTCLCVVRHDVNIMWMISHSRGCKVKEASEYHCNTARLYSFHVVLHIRCIIMWYKNGRESAKQPCREVSRNKSHPRYVVVLRFREVKIEDEMRKIRRQGILPYDLSTVSRIDGRKECSAQWNASDSKCMTLLSEEHAELSERERNMW